MLETGEDEDGFGAALADQLPGVLQLAKIVSRAGQDRSTRIRQVHRMLVAEAVHTHLDSPP